MAADDRWLFDRAPCGLIEATADGRIRRANLTFCDWLGHPPEALTQRRFQDLLTVGGRIFHHTHWAPLLRMQHSISEVKLEVVHRDGASIPMILNATQRVEDGLTIDYIAAYIARDRDRYEQELVRSRRKLEQLVAELNELHAQEQTRARFAEQMIGIVSHDLRNPLSAIQMAAGLLAAAGASEQRYVERIDRAVTRANGLIEDLLDLTRARLGGGIAVEPVRVALHDVVADTVEELKHVHPERRIVHQRDGGATCKADPARLAQVVGNLVSNAVAYGDPAAPITVTSCVGADECAVTVHNLGSPIPGELQHALFEPMTRGTQAGAKSRSVGLGLFIVREIARAHGGDARVTSSAADGTRFRVAWPA